MLHAADRFLLRSPLLPFTAMFSTDPFESAETAYAEQWSRESYESAFDKSHQRVVLLASNPAVREAIRVASPALAAALAAPIDTKTGCQPHSKVERSLVRYLSRMSARPTPFGLFAGCSVGTVRDGTDLRIGPAETYRRRTRLDMDYTFALAAMAAADPEMRAVLRYVPNNSIYRVAGQMRYVESRYQEAHRSHHLVSVEAAEHLDAVLAAAARGATLEDLMCVLRSAVGDDDVSADEMEAFLSELVDTRLLVPELEPPVTGTDPQQSFINDLSLLDRTGVYAPAMVRVTQCLRELDAVPVGSAAHIYDEVTAELRKLRAPVDPGKLFQVDLFKPSPFLTVAKSVGSDLIRAIEVLHRVSDKTEDPLATFIAAFSARYGEQEVPLTEALDEDVGIGFPVDRASTDHAPLLAGLFDHGVTKAQESTQPLSPKYALLLSKLIELGDGHELVLSDDDIGAMGAPPGSLPDALHVVFSLGADRKGSRDVLIKGAWGPSGARMIGRFCLLDEEIETMVRTHISEEAAASPDVTYAELVHLPQGRIGNIIARPILREFEIVYVGRSGATSEKQIPVSDLYLRIVKGEIVIRSARLGRRVVPRLTSAHNYNHARSLPVYRFLGALQNHRRAPVGWQWGPFQQLSFLPRVRLGPLVLQRARWTLSSRDVADLKGPKDRFEQFLAVQRLRAERRLPRLVEFTEGDNELPVDLDDPLSVETLLHELSQFGAVLTEMFPEPADLACYGDEGPFPHEAILMFVRAPSGEPSSTPAEALRPAERVRPTTRNVPPGLEWLYFKLFMSQANGDRVLRRLMPAIRAWSASYDRWFFIRYADPDFHIRIRFHGDSQLLHAMMLPQILSSVMPLIDGGIVRRVQLDTYEKEIERYGGAEALEIAELLFMHDSNAVLRAIEEHEGGEDADRRWMAAIAGIDTLLDDFSIPLVRRHELVTRLRSGFGRQLMVDQPSLKQQLASLFRRHRQVVTDILEAPERQPSLTPIFDSFRTRSQDMRDVVDGLAALGHGGRLAAPIDDLLASYIHMHVNRMMPALARQQEFLIYDLLSRGYESAVARRRKKGPLTGVVRDVTASA